MTPKVRSPERPTWAGETANTEVKDNKKVGAFEETRKAVVAEIRQVESGSGE